jgi:hypothetical protein
MNSTILGFKYFFVAISAALLISACNPCEGVVCDYGTCANGQCVCEEGYERKNTECKPLHERYVNPEDSAVIATLVVTDANGTSRSYNNIGYVFQTSSDNPFQFTLANFNFLNNNNITFEINPANYSLLIPGTTTTAINETYAYEGRKEDGEVILKITDTRTTFVYDVRYTRS